MIGRGLKSRSVEAWRGVSIALVLSSLLLLPVHGAVSAPKPVAQAQATVAFCELGQQIERILADKALADATVGVKIIDTESGTSVFDRNGSRRMIVASNVKLFTAAAALDILGDEYQFRTGLYARGKKAGGTLQGDLVVKASGDPNLSGRFEPSITAIFEHWAAAVRQAGISKVDGDLLIDDTVFDREFVHPTWPREQRTRWYSAQVAGFSLNDNCIDIAVAAGAKAGAPAVLSVQPATQYVSLLNKIKTVKKDGRHLIHFSRKLKTNTVTVSGSFRENAQPFRGHATVHNPSAFAGTVLREVFGRAGVVVTGRVVLADAAVDVENLSLLEQHTSPLILSLHVMNKRSQNFYAEQILKTIGHASNEQGSFATGTRAVREFLRKKARLSAGFEMADGSGLSRTSRFSAGDVVDLLHYMHRSAHAAAFKASLAIPGTDWTLRKRLKDPACVQRVRAKTGTLNGVSALSGYATGSDGTQFVFSIVMNGYKGSTAQMRQIQDRIVKLLVGYEAAAP